MTLIENLKKFIFAVAAVIVCCIVGISAWNKPATVSAATATRYLKSVETDAEGWSWNGFTLVANEQASRVWETGTYSASATGEYRYKGDYLEIYGYKGPEGGEISVEIDGVAIETLSLKASADTYKALLGSYETSYGWHTLKITSLTEGKWHSIDYIKIDIGKEAYCANYNLALVGNILCSVMHPTGGGNRDLNVVRNEKVYEVGVSGVGPLQYDSYNGSGRGYFYMGYTFTEELTFSRLVFQEGETWFDGGWFADGDVKVQVQTNSGWKDVTLVSPVNYPVSDTRADFGQNCEIYTFDFEPIAGKAIRLIGMSGGSSNFVSVAQIEVYSNRDALTLHGGYDYKNAVVFEPQIKPVDEDPGQSSSSSQPSSETQSAEKSSAQSAASQTPAEQGGCNGTAGAAALSSLFCLAAATAFIKRKNTPDKE